MRDDGQASVSTLLRGVLVLCGDLDLAAVAAVAHAADPLASEPGGRVPVDPALS